jgi:type VI secretion system protein ImpC
MGELETRELRRVGWKPLTYTVHPDHDEPVEVPFVIGVVADLTGVVDESRPPFKDRQFVYVDADNLDDVMRAADPRVRYDVANLLDEAGSSASGPLAVHLSFDSLAAFRPASVASRIEALDRMMRMREQLAPLAVRLEIRPTLGDDLRRLMADRRVQAAFDAPGAQGEPGVRLDDLFELHPELVVAIAQWPRVDQGLLIQALRTCEPPVAGDMRPAVLARITDIDQRLSRQLDLILHHPDFKRLEATWRGLAYLTREAETGSLLKLRVLNVSTKELIRSFRIASRFDQSALFRKLYDDEASTFGYEPVALVVCDYALAHDADGIYLAENLSRIGAAVWAPIVVGASPALFSLDDWQQLPAPRDLSKIFETVEYRPWEDLRKSSDANHLVVALPPLMARLPWDTRDAPSEHAFVYVESVARRADYTWMNGAFGLAAVVAQAFARDRWCADLRGPVWGRIDGVPAHYLVQEGEIVDVVGPTEVDLSERRHSELGRLGFASIARHVRGEFAAMPGPTVLALAPPLVDRNPASGNRNTSQLEHALCVGRVAQVVRCFLKDHVGVWASLEGAADAVQSWLSGYCTPPESDGTPSASANAPPDASHGVSRVASTSAAATTATGGALADTPVAPFTSVRVTTAPSDARGRRPDLVVDLEMNYVPGAAVVRRVLLTFTPAGFLSSRIVR